MDDVCAISNAHDKEAKRALFELTKGRCYLKPLHMTNDSDTHFLETELLPDKVTGLVQFKHWNKNASTKEQEFYRGKHFHSIGPMQYKIGAIKGTCVRIDRNSSTVGNFHTALQEKCKELQSLKYRQSNY